MNEDIKLWDKIKTSLDYGVSSSRKVMDNAKKKSRKIEEYGVLIVDIKRLENRNMELFKDLGLKVFSFFCEEGSETISIQNPVVRDTIEELERNRRMLESKNEKLSEL